jgi:hypothetical protein
MTTPGGLSRITTKVDGIAALAMALSRAMVQTSTVSIYEHRGVLALG